MSCIVSSQKKYLERPSPPIPANECKKGTIKKGNDNNLYQIVSRKGKGGTSNRWAKCFTKGKTVLDENE